MITYGIVIAAFIIVQILVSAGLIQPYAGASGSALCLRDPGAFSEPYRGYPRRTQPRSCRVYVCRCFFQCILFRKCMEGIIPSAGLRFFWHC